MIELRFKKRLFGAGEEMTLAIDATIEEGEFVTLFGESGAGKTTILRILAGLEEPDEGIVRAGDESWFDSSAKINLPPQRRRIGFVFQDYALFPNMSVRKNLEYALEDKRDKVIVDELLKLTDLGGLEHRYPQTLSGGQKQRVALARALVRRPRILLLDEPLSALDLAMRQKLQEELLVLHCRFGITTILVSHDLAEIFKLSSKVFFLEKGRIGRLGTPHEVFSKRGMSGKFRFVGEILDIKKDDIIYALTLLIGNDIVKVVATQDEVVSLRIGDKVAVASKAFNPVIQKI